MAIFTPTGYRLRYNLTHPHKVIMHHIRDIHCAWQRATKGYCYRDIWSIDNWFLELIPKMLEEFKKIRHGYPASLTLEEWDDIIQQMKTHFEKANELTTDFVNPYEDEYLSTLSINLETNILECSADETLENNYREYARKKHEYLEENLKAGFKLFEEHFHNLWD